MSSRRGRRLLALLASRRVAVFAIGAMAALLGLAAFVPDPDALEPARLVELERTRPTLLWVARHLRPQEVVRSPLFLALPGFLSLGIASSLAQRLAAELRRAPGRSPGAERFRAQRSFGLKPEDAGADPAATLSIPLRRDGYEVVSSAPGSLEAIRGRPGFWGSIAFHVGLILALAGVIASSLTRFNGEFLLAEGFQIPFATRSMFNLSGAGRFHVPPGSSLALRDFTAEYSPKGTPTDYAAILTVEGRGERPHEQQVRVNQAVHWGGYQITLHRYGFAPALAASGPPGTPGVDAVAVLQLLPPGREDALQLSDGSRILLRLYPDFATLQGAPASRSLAPVRPVLFFRWVDGASRELAAGRVERGERATANGYTVGFPALFYWGGFVVARDLGLWLFVVASLLGSLGIGLRIAFPDQVVRLSWQPCEDGIRVEMAAGTRFFPSLHEEQLDRLVARMKKEAS